MGPRAQNLGEIHQEKIKVHEGPHELLLDYLDLQVYLAATFWDEGRMNHDLQGIPLGCQGTPGLWVITLRRVEQLLR